MRTKHARALCNVRVQVAVTALVGALCLLAIMAGLWGCAASDSEDQQKQTVVVSFRAGGATDGSVDSVEVQVGDTIKLPENGFKWRRHYFVGWVPGYDEDGEPLEPGTEVVVEDETVYVAVWSEHVSTSSAVKVIDWDYESTWAKIEVHEEDTELEGTMGGWGGKESGGVIMVRNQTARVINLAATLTFVQRGGHDWLSSEYDVFDVAPGDRRMIHATDLNRSDGLRWHIEVRDAHSWTEPLKDNVRVEEVEATDDAVTIRLTNEGAHVARVFAVKMAATLPDKTLQGGDAFMTGDLEPGQSLDVTFEKKNMFEPDAITTFAETERVYYLDGYMNLND